MKRFKTDREIVEFTQRLGYDGHLIDVFGCVHAYNWRLVDLDDMSFAIVGWIA